MYAILILSVVFGELLCQNLSARNFNSDCGQVFTKNQFIIESLDYPSNYPLNYECSYLLKGPSCPTRFTLQFLDFSVEESLGCSKDRLEIDDKDALCGNRNDIKSYFSEKGTLLVKFVSDFENTGRGYRILVTRSQCTEYTTNNNDVEYTTQRPNKNNCCPTTYNSKQFVLTSPNFPYSMSTPTECSYEIRKANVNICRLRIHVKFFWLARTNSCNDGFLEIDGKHICGCKSDLKIIAPFQGQSTKILRFVTRGFERSSYSGFVLEVIQDECPNKVSKNASRSFRFYNDQINRVAFNNSNDAVVEKLHLIGENTEVLGEKAPQVVRHVYFYSGSDFNRIPRDREETEYIDTSSRSDFGDDNGDYGFCRNWNQLQFNGLSLRRLPVCKSSEGSVRESCVELDQKRGYFKSPGYPFYYPGNMNVCYRFRKLPGHCSITIHMKDFSLQNSDTCEYDYLLFPNQLRYCGTQLINTISTLQLKNQPYQQMNFISDSVFCGRGFFGSYEQIPCQESPINPTEPTTPCSKTVQNERFTFDVYDYNNPHCSLIIRKYSQEVCSVELFFEKFDLVCAVESLVIDGMVYCGHLSGQNVKIDVTNKDPVIVYRRSSNAGISGLRFRIKGSQISDCPEAEVPAERFLSSDRSTFTKYDNHNNLQFVLKMGRNFKDICGIVTNTTESSLPATFCDLITKNEKNITNCLPLKENSFIVPLNESHKIELKIQDAEKTEEIEFHEVDCDSI